MRELNYVALPGVYCLTGSIWGCIRSGASIPPGPWRHSPWVIEASPRAKFFSQTPRLGGLGSIVSSPAGSGAEPQRPTHLEHLASGADPGIYLGGGIPRSLIESWGRSPSRGREAPENWGRSPNRGRSPRKKRGRGLGRGLGEPLLRKFLKNQTWNHSFWCIFEAIIWCD